MLKDNREDDGGEKKRTEGERGRESTVKNNKQKKNKACVERERFTTQRPSLRPVVLCIVFLFFYSKTLTQFKIHNSST